MRSRNAGRGGLIGRGLNRSSRSNAVPSDEQAARTLVTLKDAADLIAQEFSTVMAWGALETAIERLMLAATIGTHADIRAATVQLELRLRVRRRL